MPPKHNVKRKREINSQPARKALKNGELDVDKFTNARQYEIRALEQGMAQSKAMLTKRAFQQVPKDLRRRTASHNVKRVPKRLQRTARREMVDDKTPKKGRVGMMAGMKGLKGIGKGKMRLRLQKLQTARKLRELERQSKKKASVGKDEGIAAGAGKKPTTGAAAATTTAEVAAVTGRKPWVKKSMLATAPVPRGKHRKRQAHKSWLPTHIFHAKRAHLTPPSNPLWRFAIPLTPTAKAYRPTHRSFSQRGAIAWDTSHMSTISVDGRQQSLEGVLKGLGFGMQDSRGTADLWASKGERWRAGKRAGQGWLFEREGTKKAIAPATVIWNPVSDSSDTASKQEEPRLRHRKLFIRVHPSAFFQTWEEVVRLAKIAKPAVSVEDLRFEIGSIEVTGPASTEALLGALWPNSSASSDNNTSAATVEAVFQSLAGLSDPAMLPANAVLGLDVQDPRLHHPPRTVKLDQTAGAQHELLEVLSSWPLDNANARSRLFERKARTAASTSLPSQKAINRRRTLSRPGEYPDAHPSDPSIPVVLYTSSVRTVGSSNDSKQGSWTVLLPWKCVLPVWYGLQYYPISTGGQPRFGGLRETQQMHFERGTPWFPGDFASTKGGWEWELKERGRRKDEWARRPKCKRTSWEAVDLGNGRKGEIGLGWACHWERLLQGPAGRNQEATAEEKTEADASSGQAPSTPSFTHVPASQAVDLVKPLTESSEPAIDSFSALTTVRIALVNRGTPKPCARVYRLPSNTTDPSLRKAWLALGPGKPTKKFPGSKHSLPRPARDAPAHIRQQHLAASLLEPPRAGEDDYPVCPDEEDLIGFVTTGNYDLGAGKGTGIGNVVVGRIKEGLLSRDASERLCVVRNAGEGLGRLATWTLCE